MTVGYRAENPRVSLDYNEQIAWQVLINILAARRTSQFSVVNLERARCASQAKKLGRHYR